MKQEKRTIQDKINEYEKASVHNINSSFIKSLLTIVIGIFIVFLGNFIMSIISKAFSLNLYIGYISIIFCVLFIVFVFVIPIMKLLSINEFKFDAKRYNKDDINKYNDKVCYSISKNIIDFSDKLPDAQWYDENLVENLKLVYRHRDISEVRNILTELINKSIKDNSNKIIIKYAVQAAASSAVSQSNKLDAVLVFITDIVMVKDLIFLYGFRPTIIKMAKICISVFVAVAVASGLQTSQVGKNVIQGAWNFIKGFLSSATTVTAVTTVATGSPGAPLVLLGQTAKEFVIAAGDSAIQGLSNGIITALIGYQTIAYLNKEYKLQDNLKNIDLLDQEEEFEDTCKKIESELKQKKQNKKIDESNKVNKDA